MAAAKSAQPSEMSKVAFLELEAPDLLEALRRRNLSDDYIETMSAGDMFDEYCMWKSLVGWGAHLRRIMAAANACDTQSSGGTRASSEYLNRPIRSFEQAQAEIAASKAKEAK